MFKNVQVVSQSTNGQRRMVVRPGMRDGKLTSITQHQHRQADGSWACRPPAPAPVEPFVPYGPGAARVERSAKASERVVPAEDVPTIDDIFAPRGLTALLAMAAITLPDAMRRMVAPQSLVPA